MGRKRQPVTEICVHRLGVSIERGGALPKFVAEDNAVAMAPFRHLTRCLPRILNG